MTEDNMESQQNEFGNLVLPENGVTDLTDKLTEYMTEIELGGVPDILGQSWMILSIRQVECQRICAMKYRLTKSRLINWQLRWLISLAD